MIRCSERRVSAAYGSHPLALDAPKWAVRLLLGCVASLLVLTPAASRQLTAVRVSEGGDLQAALDAARPGDTILLAPGARFVGNFVLPQVEGATSFMTLRTDGAGLPREGVRTGPQYAGRLAVLQSPNNDPALRTAPAAHHWRIENVEFRASRDGNNEIISLGSASQTSREEVPHTLVLDRLLITGDPQLGQKRGIALNSAATEIRNCYIAGIRGVGMDTQAILGWNGPGPFLIENNYLEGAGENVMFGGGTPMIPDLVPTGITMRRNLLSKPLAWRDPIVATPSALRAAVSTVGGGLGAGTYIYSVVAERPSGQATTAVSVPSAPVTAKLDSSNGTVALEWAAVPGAAAYRVYRTSPEPSTMWRTETTRFTDTGAAGKAATPPAKGTTWSVKNIFELKNARDVLFEGNVLERNWLESQAGYAILMQPTNPDARAPWTTIENVRIVNNIIRDVAGAVHILATDQKHDTGHARGITIANNLIANVDKDEWGGAGDFLLIGAGPTDLRVEHNTVLNTGRIISVFGGKKDPKYSEGFVFRNNLVRHNEYGVKGDGVNSGDPTLSRYFPGATFEGNVIAGGNRSQYPRGNEFVSPEEFESQFIGSGNYRLKPGSPYRGAGADIERIEAATGVSAIVR
jgi:hypothetical protein